MNDTVQIPVGRERHPLAVDLRAGDRGRPADEVVDRTHDGAGRQPSRCCPCSTSCARTTRARPSVSWPTPEAGSAGRFRRWPWACRSGSSSGCASIARATHTLLGCRPGADPRRRASATSSTASNTVTWSTSSMRTGARRISPAFNVADAAISIGAALVVLDALLEGASRAPHRMKILLANPRGFCAGVDRAIDIVERAIDTVRRADLRAPRGRAQRARGRAPAPARRGVRRRARPGARRRDRDLLGAWRSGGRGERSRRAAA